MVTLCPFCNSAKTHSDMSTVISENESGMMVRDTFFCQACKRSFFRTTVYKVEINAFSKDAKELTANELLLSLCKARPISDNLNVRPDDE